MKIEYTARGFALGEFADRNGEKCSIQNSSLAIEAAIWLGTDEANPQVLIPGKGWTHVEFPEHTLFNTRMHLTQKQVAEDLLPALHRFVRTGSIDLSEEENGYYELVGKKVKKDSGKPFQSKNKINTVKSIVFHPQRFVLAFSFEEDNSLVECGKCSLATIEDAIGEAIPLATREISNTIKDIEE